MRYSTAVLSHSTSAVLEARSWVVGLSRDLTNSTSGGNAAVQDDADDDIIIVVGSARDKEHGAAAAFMVAFIGVLM